MANAITAMAGTVYLDSIPGIQYLKASGAGVPSGSNMIITGARFSRAEALQHVRTISGHVFTYSFGELPGTGEISGLVFAGSCGRMAPSLSGVASKYESNRAFKGGRGYVAIGGASFPALLTGLTVGGEASEFAHGRFTLSYTIIPKNPPSPKAEGVQGGGSGLSTTDLGGGWSGASDSGSGIGGGIAGGSL